MITKDIFKSHLGVIGILLTLLLLSSIALGFVQRTGTETSALESKAVDEQESSKEIEVINKANLPEDQLSPILAYYQVFFDGFTDLSGRDLASHFDQSDPEGVAAGYYEQIYYDQLTNIYKNAPINLSINSYLVTLNIKSQTPIDSNRVMVTVFETQDMVYAGSSDIHSITDSINNVFQLKNVDGKWVIARHERVEALYRLISRRLEEKGLDMENRMANLTEIKNELSAEFDEANSQLKAAREELKANPVPAKESPGYNRNAAVNYAHAWYNQRNPEYHDYSDVGGNCNNFVSQALIAGGLQEDLEGYEIWHSGEEEFGESYSWYRVSEFNDYVTDNTEGGFKATLSDNVYSGQIGDLLVLGSNENLLHTVIITGLVKDKDGNTVDYLIDSNTLDKRETPVSIYGYPQMRLIKILGNQ